MKKPEGVPRDVTEEQLYILKLYIVGGEQNSQLAQANLKRICDEYLNGRCQVEEVDVLTNFAAALDDRVFVTPTLILVAPEPRATVIGNLSDKERVISALRLRFEHGT
jgi:circadian clock protein KaiB